MNLSEVIKPSSLSKISPSLCVHSTYNKEDNDKNAFLLKKYFPKYYQYLNLNVRSGPVITKVKRVKTIRSFSGFLQRKASQYLGLTLLKGQFKSLQKLPSIDTIAFWKKEKTFTVFPDVLNKYLPYFTQIHQLKINFRAELTPEHELKIAGPIKVSHFVSRIKTLRTFSVVVEGDLAPLEVLDAFFKKLQKWKAAFERLEDFAVWVWNRGEKNHWEKVFKKYPLLMKYVTLANIELFSHSFTAEGINLLINNSPKLKSLTTLLKLEDHDHGNLNFDQLKQLGNLKLTTDSDVVLFTQLLRLSPSIETLKLQFTNQKPISEGNLLVNSTKDFYGQWKQLDKLRELELKMIGRKNLLKTFEVAFSPLLEKIPQLLSLNIAFENDLHSDPMQSGPIEPDFETSSRDISCLFSQNSFQNLVSTLKTLALNFGENEIIQEENLQILKHFENLSSLSLSTNNLGKSLAIQILQHFLKTFKNKSQYPQERLVIKLETIHINSLEELLVFLKDQKNVKMTENLSGKISLQAKVILKKEDDYKLCFEEICKFMSSSESSSGIYLKFEFKNSSYHYAFTEMIKSYPKCKKFKIILPRSSLYLTYQNGSQTKSKCQFPWAF